MRVPRPALVLLAAAVVTGVLGADRAGHFHRGAEGAADHFHRHAHLGAHRHAGGGATDHDHDHDHHHGHGHGHAHGDRHAPEEPAAPPAPDPPVPQDGGYYQPPAAPPIPATAPSIDTVAAAAAVSPAPRAKPVDLASRHDPFRPRPPPA